MKFSQTGTGDDSDDVCIDLNDPCTLTFAVKYLNHFCKASSLSERVTLSLSNDNPLGKQNFTPITILFLKVVGQIFILYKGLNTKHGIIATIPRML